jgi:hypothetical protein
MKRKKIKMTYNRNYAPATALELELDGVPEDHHAQLVVRLLAHLKTAVIRAMEDKAGSTERGRTLRRTAAIKVYVGTTGRTICFGPPAPDEDELKQLQAWRGVVAECLDTLSLSISFGNFLADIEGVFGLPDNQQYDAKARMVGEVKARGGLLWDKKKLDLKKIGKIFKDWKENCLLFQGWVLEVQEVEEKAAAKAKAEAEALAAAKLAAATTDEVAVQVAAALNATVGDPKPSIEEIKAETRRIKKAAQEAKHRLEQAKADLEAETLRQKLAASKTQAAAIQESRLAAVGGPSMDKMAADADAVSKLINGMDRDMLARFKAALAAKEESVVQADVAKTAPGDIWRNQL